MCWTNNYRLKFNLNFLCFFWLLFFSTNLYSQEMVSYVSHSHSDNEISHAIRTDQTVYICTGLYAYAYHSRSTCPGLGNCKGDINYTNENYAINSLNRVPCCRCWNNVIGRCKDDNPYYGGGYSSGGYEDNSAAYLALAFITLSAVILSNDVYLYQVNSFYKNIGEYNDTGWILGFRKTFDKSALEYGVSKLKRNSYNSIIDGDHRWGWHVNYVHEVYNHDIPWLRTQNNRPNWLKLYIGPSINYVYDLGIGGILGTKVNLTDRLKLDFRYECTTQTNQVQAGLIYTYQKEYFWRK